MFTHFSVPVKLFRTALLFFILVLLLTTVGQAQSGESTPAESEMWIVTYEAGTKGVVLDQVWALGGVVRHEFDNIQVLAITLPSEEAELLAGHQAVRTLEEDPLYFPLDETVPYGIDMVQARDTWDVDRDGIVDPTAPSGGGIKLCVVDTGIYATHEDLGGGGLAILAGRSWVGEDWARDLQGHGTHVSGTAAAMNNGRGVVGVSPGTVGLIVADVFNDAGDAQASSTILAAANWCADQGANIISMSLGGRIGTLAAGYQALYERGVLIVAAAGNDGVLLNSYPASYDHVVSVAAVDSTGARASFSNMAPAVELAAPGVSVLSTYPFQNSVAVADGPTYPSNPIVNADPVGSFGGVLANGGDCNTAAAPGSYSGKVVLCERGGAPFRVKIDNAAAGGAAAAIIYNNVPGNFSGTYGEPCCSSIPAVSLSQADGQDALNYVDRNVTLTIDLESTAGYAELSGTSMATPHASGAAAVLWSACPELTHDQLRSHLARFALEPAADAVPGRDPLYGYGIPQIRNSVEALFDGVNEYDPNNPNDDGSRPANVECPAPLLVGTLGSGWMRTVEGRKLNFSFDILSSPSGPEGTLSLNDDVARAKIRLSQVTAISEVTGACGGIPAGLRSIEVHGTGSFNMESNASFRLCMEDNADPGAGADRFYLECTAGCSYNTAARTPDNIIDAGNIDVQRAGRGGGGGGGGGSGEAGTLMLDPPLLSEGVVGQLQTFTITAYDRNQQRLSDVRVTLTRTTANGQVEELSALTGPTGIATFTLVTLDQVTEYVASTGGLQSNAIRIVPLLE